MEDRTIKRVEEGKTMKLELPEGAKVGSIVLVTWDVAASAEVGAENLEPGPQEGRIIRIDGHRVTVYLEWPNEPDVDVREMTTVIDLETGEDDYRGGIVEAIELRTRRQS